MFDVVVVYLLRPGENTSDVLLGEKRRGLGLGRLVGPGGKVTPGEKLADAAAREVREEVGLVIHPQHLAHRGTLTYPFRGRPENSQRSFVFTATEWAGTPKPSDELIPSWYSLDAIPWEQMWDDAKLWLPRVFDGHFVEATLTIGPEDQVIESDWVSR